MISTFFELRISAVKRAFPIAASLYSSPPRGIQASKLRHDEILKLRLQACPLREQHRAESDSSCNTTFVSPNRQDVDNWRR